MSKYTENWKPTWPIKMIIIHYLVPSGVNKSNGLTGNSVIG